MFPNSYLENNRIEKDFIQLADNFHRQFKYLYPDRIKPPLYLENECKVNKIVCTTLCPFKVKMPTEMKKSDFCANFFAEYFDYEVLQSPFDCPEQLHSVERIVKRRKGNSLELSTALCSFLLASDYDVYVVQGYARRNVCEMLVNSQLKPPISFFTKSRYHKRYFTSNTPQPETVPKNKYEVDFERLKSFWMEGKSIFRPPGEQEPKPEAPSEESQEEDSVDKRIHFWILAMSCEKGSLKPLFIEPTTGEEKSIDDLDYLGVEFVWNNKNFWCNKQNFESSCKNLNFDVRNSGLWEPFLPEYNIEEEFDKPMLMPETWVKNVEITQEDVDSRLPEGGRTFHYKMATVVKYNAGSLNDGLVYHATYYKTEDKKKKEESHSFYSRRKDHLEYRKTDFLNKRVRDVFALGRTDSLKEHEYPLEGTSHFPQKLEFYAHLRKDKLSCRVWTESMSLDEFEDRTDRLTSRKADLFQGDDVSAKDSDRKEESVVAVPDDETEIDVAGEKVQDELQATDETELMGNAVKVTESPEPSKEETEGSKEKTERVDEATGIREKKITETKAVPETESSETTKDTAITPASFEPDRVIFENVDFSTWKREFFLNSIDPAERYATSESESDEEQQSQHSTEQHVSDRKESAEERDEAEEEKHQENASQTTSKEMAYKSTKKSQPAGYSQDDEKATEEIQSSEERSSDETTDEFTGKKREVKFEDEFGESKSKKGTDESEKENTNSDEEDKREELDEDEQTIDTENETDETEAKKGDTEGELDKEMEIYDEINFDALSDEELEVDYQLFLSKVWSEYLTTEKRSLIYMTHEFNKYKDLHNRDILKLKKRIIRKRRNNLRYMQRMKTGAPEVRKYKTKSVESSEREKSVYTDELMNSLGLKDILKVEKMSDVKPFVEIDELEKSYVDLANCEIITNECMMLLNKKLKDNQNDVCPKRSGNIRRIKNSFARNPSLPVEFDVESIWFDFELDSFRLDFHYPADQTGRKILIFQKPRCGSVKFNFSDVLCRQILPAHETRPVRKCQMYSYMAALIKKEPLVLREYLRFQGEMREILDARCSEEREQLKLKPLEAVAEAPGRKDEEESRPGMGEVQLQEQDEIDNQMDILNLFLPLSSEEAQAIFLAVVNDFCDAALAKHRRLEEEFEETTKSFDKFLESCKNWSGQLTEQQEESVIEECAKFRTGMSSVKHFCDAQSEAIKANFHQLKKKLYHDPRLRPLRRPTRKDQTSAK